MQAQSVEQQRQQLASQPQPLALVQRLQRVILQPQHRQQQVQKGAEAAAAVPTRPLPLHPWLLSPVVSHPPSPAALASTLARQLWNWRSLRCQLCHGFQCYSPLASSKRRRGERAGPVAVMAMQLATLPLLLLRESPILTQAWRKAG